jgi:hypothetical protein
MSAGRVRVGEIVGHRVDPLLLRGDPRRGRVESFEHASAVVGTARGVLSANCGV